MMGELGESRVRSPDSDFELFLTVVGVALFVPHLSVRHLYLIGYALASAIASCFTSVTCEQPFGLVIYTSNVFVQCHTHRLFTITVIM